MKGEQHDRADGDGGCGVALVMATFWCGLRYTEGQPVRERHDVAFEVGSLDGPATLEATVGLRVVSSSGEVLDETDP